MAHKFVTGIQLCSSCEQAASYRAWTNRQWSKGIRANHSVKDRCTETLLITAAQAVTAVMDGVGALICPGDNLILFRWCGGRRDGRYSARTCTTRIGSKRQRIVAFLQPLHALFRRLLHQVFNPRGCHDRRYLLLPVGWNGGIWPRRKYPRQESCQQTLLLLRQC